MIRGKYIKGNILPTVLVIGTVMLLGVLISIDLYDMKWRLSAGNYAELQRNAWIESGLLLYRMDSTFWEQPKEEKNVIIFEDSKQSTINMSQKNWGLYELIAARTYDKKLKRICMMGYNVDTSSIPALYVCDNNQALTLAGNSNLRGLACLPEAGILYSQIESAFYGGEYLDNTCIRRSSPDMPACDVTAANGLPGVGASGHEQELNKVSLKVPFAENTLFIKTNGIYGSSLKGNIVIYSDVCIDLYRDTYMEDVLLFAPKVKIHNGFRGALQIISTDSVIIDSGVTLDYPSGIFIREGGPDSYIEINSKSQLNGYVIFSQKEMLDEEKLSPHYLQKDSTYVRGLVWIDGISQIHGGISGSLYCNNLNYYTPQGFYRNTLYNTRIYGTDALAYPLWLKTDNRKKIIKWVG